MIHKTRVLLPFLRLAVEAIADIANAPIVALELILPEMFEPVGRQRRIAHRRGNAAVAKVVLDSPRVLAVVGQLHLALQYKQLLPQRGILCFKSALGLEDRGAQVQEEEY